MQPPRDNHQVSEAQHFEKLAEAFASFVFLEHVGLFCPDARTGPLGPALRTGRVTRRDGHLACTGALLDVERDSLYRPLVRRQSFGARSAAKHPKDATT